MMSETKRRCGAKHVGWDAVCGRWAGHAGQHREMANGLHWPTETKPASPREPAPPPEDDYDKQHLDGCRKLIYDRQSSPCTCRLEFDRVANELDTARRTQEAVGLLQVAVDLERQHSARLCEECRSIEAERDHWRITSDAHASLVMKAQDAAGTHEDVDVLVERLLSEKRALDADRLRLRAELNERAARMTQIADDLHRHWPVQHRVLAIIGQIRSQAMFILAALSASPSAVGPEKEKAG